MIVTGKMDKMVRCPIRGGSARLMHYRWFREGQEVICILLFSLQTAFDVINLLHMQLILTAEIYLHCTHNFRYMTGLMEGTGCLENKVQLL